MIFAIESGYYLFVTYILAGLVGLCVGSFLNVVIYRVPEGMSLAAPASHCPQCGYVLHWYDNIPILSYCMLGGKCRSCGGHIPFRYTAVEAANMILWLLCVERFHGNMLYCFLTMAALSVCLCVFFIDLEHSIIPDRFQVILAVLAIASVFLDTGYDWVSHLIGFAAAAVVFLSVGFGVSRKLGREALGGGDIKFAMCAGLLLGWQKFLLMMLIASISGSIVMLAKKNREGESVETPFAPFLTSGMAITLLFGNQIINWYCDLLLL